MASAAPKPSFIGAVEDSWELYSDLAADYTRGLPIGFGASSTVYAAVYRPRAQPRHPPVPCALKVLDLDSLPPNSLRLLQRETQLMAMSKHPNVLRVRGTWMDGHKLYIALRLMNAGSAADVMRYAWPGGMDEEVVRCVLKQALEGLNYLHINGFIHRDIKAANLLIDDDGTVLLGDLGVAAPLHDEDHTQPSVIPPELLASAGRAPAPATPAPISTSAPASASAAPTRHRIGKRRSFVGTPCWMAPELISGKHYDSSADIWSFGITALELAQGRAPRSRESPNSVLLQTVHSASPTLNREGGVHKYSRAFKEVVDLCLAKDPAARPTAAQLLQMPFFKNAKRKSFLVDAVLRGLPPLTTRLERRRTPSVHAHGTVDSWDFTQTLLSGLRPPPSPTTPHGTPSPRISLHAPDHVRERSHLHEPLIAEADADDAPDVFAFDELVALQRTRSKDSGRLAPDGDEGGGGVSPALSGITPPSPASSPSCSMLERTDSIESIDAPTPVAVAPPAAPTAPATPPPMSAPSAHRPATSRAETAPEHARAPAPSPPRTPRPGVTFSGAQRKTPSPPAGPKPSRASAAIRPVATRHASYSEPAPKAGARRGSEGAGPGGAASGFLASGWGKLKSKKEDLKGAARAAGAAVRAGAGGGGK